MEDREQMLVLRDVLVAQEKSLRRDECGWWHLSGEDGHAFTWGDGASWGLFVSRPSVRGWTAAKKLLSFCEVTQDGDCEGILRLAQTPTPKQAKIIREVLRVHKRKELSEEALQALRQHGAAWRFQAPTGPKLGQEVG
jgi:hypothetical protein